MWYPSLQCYGLTSQIRMGLEAHGQSTLMMLPTMINILPTGCECCGSSGRRPVHVSVIMACASMLGCHERCTAGMSLACSMPSTWAAQTFGW